VQRGSERDKDQRRATDADHHSHPQPQASAASNNLPPREREATADAATGTHGCPASPADISMTGSRTAMPPAGLTGQKPFQDGLRCRYIWALRSNRRRKAARPQRGGAGPSRPAEPGRERTAAGPVQPAPLLLTALDPEKLRTRPGPCRPDGQLPAGLATVSQCCTPEGSRFETTPESRATAPTPHTAQRQHREAEGRH